MSFSGRGDECLAHKMPFLGHNSKKFRRLTILQLNIKRLTTSKMRILQHLAEGLKSVILLQETHCTTTERLFIANFELAGSSLNKKHSLIATFVNKRLNWTSCSQSLLTSDTERLCVDVNGYKIVKIYKSLTNATANI